MGRSVANQLKPWTDTTQAQLFSALAALGLRDQNIANNFLALLFNNKKTAVFILSGNESADELARLNSFLTIRPALVYLREGVSTFDHIAQLLTTHKIIRYSPSSPETFDGKYLRGVSFIVKPANISISDEKNLKGVEILDLKDFFPILEKSLDEKLRAAVAALVAA